MPGEFALYGGTAIALQLGHRQSVDFDFFGNRAFDPIKLQLSIPFLAKARVLQRESNTLTAILHRQGDVAVSFFGVPHLPRLVPPQVSDGNGLKIAALLDLAGTEASAVQVRREKKDFLDLDVLIAKGGITLSMALSAAQAMYGASFNPQITLTALSCGNLQHLPQDTKARLAAAAGDVDLDRLPGLVELDPALTLRVHQLVQTDRKFPQPQSGRGKYRIAERGCNQRHGGLADAAGRFVALHEMHVELRHFVAAQQPVMLKLVCCTRPPAIVTSPHSAADRPKMMPLSICDSTMRGLTIWPQSTTQTILCTLSSPPSIEISATCARWVV